MIAVDTGYFYALTDRRDAWHARELDCARRLDGEPMVTTWPVLTEACHLMAARLGTGFANELLADVVEGGIFDCVLPSREARHGRILTTDTRDFGAYRWKSRKPFKNVLAEAK